MAPVNPYHGEFPERTGLTEDEMAVLREFENAESRITIGPPRIHPFNQGRWPSAEEIAARKAQVREQMKRMKKNHPALYKTLPLLHEADD